jgi:hypothetical protein
MPRFLDAAGKATNNESAAAQNPKGAGPVANPARDIWVPSTALTTALNTAYFAEGTATFMTVRSIALLLPGFGFWFSPCRLPADLREDAARRADHPDHGRTRRRLSS